MYAKYRTIISGLLLAVLLAQPRAIVAAPQSTRAQHAQPLNIQTPDAPLDIPTPVIPSGVADYALAAPKIFWHQVDTSCDPDVHTKTVRDRLFRIAVQGSMTRTLYDRTKEDAICATALTSNFVADSDNLYWATSEALLRLPTIAITQTEPTTISTSIVGAVELLLAGDSLYALTPSAGIWKVTKPNGTPTLLVSAGNIGSAPSNFQTDGAYLYWLTAGKLKRYPFAGGSVTQIGGSGVTAYHPSFNLCLFPPCADTTPSGVYVATGNSVARYNVITGVLMQAIYTSPEPTGSIREIALKNGYIFMLEDRQTGPADPLPPISAFIVRKKSDGTGADSILYTSATSTGVGTAAHMLTHDGYLYWADSGALLRLPQDASALPQTNMRITSMEVTQGIQDLNNSVMLIQGKRTVVRVHVKSDGPSVDGVTAHLYRLNAALQPIGEPLVPSNKVGQYLKVPSNPKREILDDSFWFELPLDWTNDATLRLRADLNPFHYPVQLSYANNAFVFSKSTTPSPRLEMNFVLFDYTYDGTKYAADYFNAYLPTLSWLHRAYPISQRQDNIQNSGPGLHTHYFYVHDQELRKHLDYTSDDCPDDPKDDAGLCAADYVNGYLEDIDDEDNNGASYYGMMPGFTDRNKNYWFPRGYTSGDTSNGPSDAPGSKSWDIDSTIGDWYAGHEIGHQLGRDHPTANGDPDVDDSTPVGCGHSQDDDSYPYTDARIGSGSLWGFDLGDPGLDSRLSMRIYPNGNWYDVMSYCDNQWISDYTYNGMYGSLSLFAQRANALTPNAIAPRMVNADVLRVHGSILTSTSSMKFVKVQHKPSGTPSINIAGSYQLRLRDGANSVLATMAFSPSLAHDAPGVLPFDITVPFVAGTQVIEIFDTIASKVLGSYAISPNSPTISNIHLLNATDPVTGNVQLAWDAKDVDGDALKFDIFYSRDNGATFQPVLLNTNEHTVNIDTTVLGGSAQALFKVRVSDGANTSSGNSPSFVMADKAPLVLITNPASGATFSYGQLVQFVGHAEDLQMAGIPDGQLTWRNQYGALGTGASLPIANLPVGTNIITLTAVRNTGLQSSASMTVEVTDDLNIPGPTLAVGPTQIGWHFNVGATAAQTATLFVSNIGTGALSWQMQISETWLTADVISGTAPSQIVLTAHPELIVGDSASTVLHITASGQSLSIPVNATFGNAFNGNQIPDAAIVDRPRLYLPMLQR